MAWRGCTGFSPGCTNVENFLIHFATSMVLLVNVPVNILRKSSCTNTAKYDNILEVIGA